MSTRDGPVAACVKTALERYLRQLDGEKTTDLYDMVLEQVEKPLLEIIMTHTQSNQCKAADMLGINRNTLRKKLKLYGLSKHRSSTKRAARRK